VVVGGIAVRESVRGRSVLTSALPHGKIGMSAPLASRSLRSAPDPANTQPSAARAIFTKPGAIQRLISGGGRARHSMVADQRGSR
jgi:hypothetical protein